MTHTNFAFAMIDRNFKIIDDQGELYGRVIKLKKRYTHLKVFIAIGGWAFNDPGPNARTFSRMASTPRNREIFIDSLVNFMNKYSFDGVDIDWEHPVDGDRGGVPADKNNFVLAIAEIKNRFATENSGWGKILGYNFN